MSPWPFPDAAGAGLPDSFFPPWYTQITFYGRISHLVFAPLALVIINTRLNTIPKSMEEAASDLGASHWQTLVKVLLPSPCPVLWLPLY